jgi:DNA helicase-2/ATP-dependent DNA helicase PcrA
MLVLSDEQKAVILAEGRRILVNADSGSGKTVVVGLSALKQAENIMRLKYPWASKKANVLVCTLTNSAAEHDRTRIDEYARKERLMRDTGVIHDSSSLLDRISCGTLHSFAFKMVHKYREGTRYKGSFFVDNECNREILEELIKKVRHWKKKDGFLGMLLRIDGLRHRRSVEAIVSKEFPTYKRSVDAIEKLFRELDDVKQKEGRINFTDMLVELDRLLGIEEFCHEIRKKYPVIVVDEFQDTGSLQWKIINRLVGPDSYLLVAGDDGQTVFTWADASFRRFGHFRKEYPEYKSFKLTENFRSTMEIVKLGNALLAQSRYATRRIISSETRGELPKIVCLKDRNRLYRYIVEEIKRLDWEGKSYDDIAVIYRSYQDVKRSYKGAPKPLIEYLTEAGIPFKVYGDRSKRDRPFVRVVFALIRNIESEMVNDNAWQTFLSEGLENVGTAKAKEIIKWLKGKAPNETIYPKRVKYVEALKQILEFVDAMKRVTAANEDKLKRIVDFVRGLPKVNKSIRDHILPTLYLMARKSDTLSELISKYNDLSYPLCYPGMLEPPYPDLYVTLSNCHKIKSREFDSVFYLGCEDAVYVKHGAFETRKKREAELQLLKVAVGRAQRELHLLFPVSRKRWRRGGEVANPWIFLRRCDRDLYDLKRVEKS